MPVAMMPATWPERHFSTPTDPYRPPLWEGAGGVIDQASTSICANEASFHQHHCCPFTTSLVLHHVRHVVLLVVWPPTLPTDGQIRFAQRPILPLAESAKMLPLSSTSYRIRPSLSTYRSLSGILFRLR